jgi:hypothetical protein
MLKAEVDHLAKILLPSQLSESLLMAKGKEGGKT